jgi:hypothetical protein
VKASAGRILEDRGQHKTLLKYKIPPPPLKDRLFMSPLAKEMLILKKEMTFDLTSEGEAKIVAYVTETQCTDFGLGAASVRRHVFHIAKKI